MAEGAFDKDFGYLMPFLDKVAAAASGLSDPAARDELKSLIAGEKERWSRIRGLLAGAAGKPASSANTETPPLTSRKAQNETAELPRVARFTVGSLRPGGRQ